jgi:pre-mRNA-splicing factor ATP-dependent RNA helicase DHX16
MYAHMDIYIWTYICIHICIIREQLSSLCERVEIEVSLNDSLDIEAICKAMTAGYFYNTSKLSKSGEYKTVKQSHTVFIHPSSVMCKDEDPPRWLMYHELAFTTKVRNIASCNPHITI